MINKNIKALVAKGWTLDYAGFSSKDVIHFYDEAIKVDPQYSDAWFNKGLLLDRTRLHKKAIECFDEILSYDPENVRALYCKGASHVALKQFGKGRFCCEAALSIEPKNVFALCTMVWCLATFKKI